MNWVSLESRRQPKYDQMYFLYSEHLDKYDVGVLKKIESTKETTYYWFSVWSQAAANDEPQAHFTHFATPTPPKKIA